MLFAKAQPQQQIDSLMLAIQQADDTKQSELKFKISQLYANSNPAKSIDWAEQALEKSNNKIERGKINLLKHGNLNSIRTFVDIEDAMEAYWLAAKKGKIGEIIKILRQSGQVIVKDTNVKKKHLKPKKEGKPEQPKFYNYIDFDVSRWSYNYPVRYTYKEIKFKK
jgi:dTDP-D-glucose 4,6-dehydratase